MGHHHPYDPPDPLNPAFFLTFIAPDDEGRNGSSRGARARPGRGLLLLALIAATLLIFAIAIGLTQ
jgi:hypothetical protein